MTMTIKTIDLSPLTQGSADDQMINQISSQILKSCHEIGFFCLKGTAIPPALIADMHRLMIDIFATDEAAKYDQAITRDNYRGFIPLGFFTPNGHADNADQYEGFKLHHETPADHPIIQDCGLYGPNRWPRHTPHAREIILDYWHHLDQLTLTLLELLEQGLGLPKGQLQAPMDMPLTNMTLLHYPDRDPGLKPSGIHPHKDTDVLTIIAPDPVGGLEVRTPDGTWIEPDCPEGGVIVNIGDMLELWSGGRLVSTPHRVVNRSGKARYSFPYFAVPRHDVVISPLMPPLDGFDRPDVHCGHWSREIWRTNWQDESPDDSTPELGTLSD